MQIKMNSPMAPRMIKAVVLDGCLYVRHTMNPYQTTIINEVGHGTWCQEKLEDLAECVNAQPIYGGDSITLTF